MHGPLLALAVFAAPVVAHAAIVVERPEIRPTLGQQKTAAAYMTLRNTGDRPDKLVGVTCDCAATVMPHRTVSEHGVSRMEMETGVAIPAHGTVIFDARGRHLMLTGVKRPIRAGDKTPMVLKFETAGPVRAVFTAADLAGMVAASHPHAH